MSNLNTILKLCSEIIERKDLLEKELNDINMDEYDIDGDVNLASELVEKIPENIKNTALKNELESFLTNKNDRPIYNDNDDITGNFTANEYCAKYINRLNFLKKLNKNIPDDEFKAARDIIVKWCKKQNIDID